MGSYGGGFAMVAGGGYGSGVGGVAGGGRGRTSTSPSQQFDPRKLFVGGVCKNNTNVEGFKAFFATFGEVEHASLNNNYDGSGGHRGFGFVTFKEQSVADTVMAQAGNLELDGRRLDAKLAIPPSMKPPPGVESTKLFIGSLPKDETAPSSEELTPKGRNSA